MATRKFLGVVLAATVLGLSQVGPASADLIYDEEIDVTGTGFGTQANILTLHDSGGAGGATDIEEGTVAWDGTDQVCTGTDVVCTPIGKTSLYTFGQLALDDAAEIILIWNPNEVGNSVETQVDEATLTIYNPDGTTFFTASLASPQYFATIGHNGVGGVGFGFRLNDAEEAELNTLLGGITSTEVANLIIGFHSSVSYVDNGPDTWTIRNLCPEGEECGPPPPCTENCNPQQVPEPQPLILIAVALLGMASVRRVRSARAH